MEEMVDLVKKRLESAIEIKVDENNFLILIKVKLKEQIIGSIAEPNEVKDMLRMLGGLQEDIPMNIEINNDAGLIKLKFNNKTDMNKAKAVMENLWERIRFIFNELVKGNYEMIRDMGDFKE